MATQAPVVYVTRFVPSYRVPVLEALHRRLGDRLMVLAGAPPHRSSLASLVGESEPSYPRLVTRNRWVFGERLHAQPFAALLNVIERPSSLLIEESPRTVTLPLLLRWAGRRGIPRVLWGHFSSNNRRLSPHHPLDAYRLAIARRAEACVCYSEPMAELLSPFVARDRLFVARNTLDMRALFAARSRLESEGRDAVRVRLGLPTDRPVFLYLGRLIAAKGTGLLMRTYDAFRAQTPATLVVIGEGPERAHMQAESAQMEAADVRFLGAIRDDERLAPYLFASDLLLNPGYLGLSVNHALACGLPVVSRRAPEGIRYHSPEGDFVIHEENGMLCAWNDPADLLAGIRHTLKHRDQMSLAARRYAEQYLTLDRMVEGLAAAIEFVEDQHA